jgi:hypothetical protein
MRPPFPATEFVILLALLVAPASEAATPAAPQVLPDSFVIARVGERPISVYGFRDAYFASDATLRPMPDSLGRLEFLQVLINKEILGQTALKAGYQFGFEDRATMRDFQNQILSNMLFLREVHDSSAIGEDSLRHVYQFYQRELKLRILYFTDRSQAEYTRQQLIGGKLLWSVALARYGVQGKTVHDGLSDWIKFQSLPIEVALQIWPLRVGEVSPIILAANGYHVVQAIDSRPATVTPYSGLHAFLKGTMRGAEATVRKERMQHAAKAGLDVVYDTTNVRWAAAHFREAVRVVGEGLGTTIAMDENVPEFKPEDSERLLATWKDGRITLGKVLSEYTGMTPWLRPSISTPERMIGFIDALILGPRMVQFALERGYDKDPVYLAQVAFRREAILVGHMVDDSVLSRINVSREERHAYYDQHPDRFKSFPEVRFAVLVRTSKAAADSTRAQLAAGVSIDSLVAIDKRRGVAGSDYGTVTTASNTDYRKILFEELRPGKNTVVGPDAQKLYAVIHEIAYDPGHLVPYEQMESSIDESVRNIKGDAAMRVFIARHAREYAIESHPELIMRIPLTDPAGNLTD